MLSVVSVLITVLVRFYSTTVSRVALAKILFKTYVVRRSDKRQDADEMSFDCQCFVATVETQRHQSLLSCRLLLSAFCRLGNKRISLEPRDRIYSQDRVSHTVWSKATITARGTERFPGVRVCVSTEGGSAMEPLLARDRFDTISIKRPSLFQLAMLFAAVSWARTTMALARD
jgi:hypothetical protein